MRVSLLPRLKGHGVTAILEKLKNNGVATKDSLEILREYSALKSSAPSGGTRADSVAVAVVTELREIAQEVGFPTVNTQSARAQFDQAAAIYLGQKAELKTGEALRDDVWAFLSVVLAPDIVAWRFTDQSRERFAGGVRNSFQRLWMRGTVLDRGESHTERWALLHELSEDAMVQIFERPSIGGNPVLAIAIAEGWLKAAKKHGRAVMEDAMRDVTKMLRLKNQIIDLSYLGENELGEIVDELFELAIPKKKMINTVNC
ncbi:DUF6339 family protein [Pseudomonas piscis]|uniref:DUF6339 family protein n=1 Tax=Pseudomonas piscis TaxID=2614538 RepID=UPI00385108DC